MTTKPKAKKFRIRRSSPLIEAGPEAHPERAPSAEDYQTASQAHAREQAMRPRAIDQQQADTPQDTHGSVGTEIDAIRKEGLTGRQLRLARRMAQKHNIPATSDFDAVRLLRNRGIDPFQRTDALELLVDNQQARPKPQPPALPQTYAHGATPNLPSTHIDTQTDRISELAKIQRDIVKRRRRKLALLFSRLTAFVAIPTIIAGIYFFRVATPMYATNSEFVIQQSEGSSSAGGFGSFLPAQFNTNQDSITVQSYMLSREAMLRLDQDAGFKAHFQQEWIDPIQRLEADATNEQAFKAYKKYVQIGYDPSEGVMKMEVIAADPVLAKQFADALIGYAEERVDSLTKRKREDQLREARTNLEEAQQNRRDAQVALVELQQQSSVVDPEAVLGTLRSQISSREVELTEKELQLQALLDNASPNQARVDGLKADIRRLETVIADLNARMQAASEGSDSLTALSAQIRLAEADLATRDMMLQSALQNMEAATLEAGRQTRYLSRGVDPVVPDAATYPRSFENTLLTLLVFSGIYLMISLTASILREQVTS
ncbi:MAG: capsule biosynthesis protein [Paracoccaceae bacterium]|jgi:capsular polysaccharide transport system permease protein|nr:capsule biosynthesis protein [Paracoccaceae bacterium]MDP7186381.1 capsule biosynthesis protein [Paracoccaceae bacterium]